MNKNLFYCGNIACKCEHKQQNGLCSQAEQRIGAGEDVCDDAVMVADPSMGFLIKYLYSVKNRAPRIITTTSRPLNNYPNQLYCTKIDERCPHQTPGGKCKMTENLPYEPDCKYAKIFTEDVELATRLIQFLHRDLDKHR